MIHITLVFCSAKATHITLHVLFPVNSLFFFYENLDSMAQTFERNSDPIYFLFPPCQYCHWMKPLMLPHCLSSPAIDDYVC